LHYTHITPTHPVSHFVRAEQLGRRRAGQLRFGFVALLEGHILVYVVADNFESSGCNAIPCVAQILVSG
jgi:hypothetical protein